MMRGLRSRMESKSTPSRLVTPGRMFSITTSACSASRSRISRPSSLFRLSVMARLLRCRFWKSEPSRRPTSSFISPSVGGGSTRITSAPQSASVRTQDGPARARVRSITLKRDSGSRGAWAGALALAGASTGLCMAVVLMVGLVVILDRNDVRGVDPEPDFLAEVEHVERGCADTQFQAAGLGLEPVVPGLAEEGAFDDAA